MEDNRERAMEILPQIIQLFMEIIHVYYSDVDYDETEMDEKGIFGHRPECFSFSEPRLCYIAVFRKLFLSAVVMLVKEGVVRIDLSDIENMEVDTYMDMVSNKWLCNTDGLMEIIVKKFFAVYGYQYEIHSYLIEDLIEGIYELEDSDGLWGNDAAIDLIDRNCRKVMSGQDYAFMDTDALFYLLFQSDWDLGYQDDIRIWRFSRPGLSGILERDAGMLDGQELEIKKCARQLSLLIPCNFIAVADPRSCVDGEYRPDGFAAVESFFMQMNYRGYYEYWCRMDMMFLNFGALLAIPYIDLLMEERQLEK